MAREADYTASKGLYIEVDRGSQISDNKLGIFSSRRETAHSYWAEANRAFKILDVLSVYRKNYRVIWMCVSEIEETRHGESKRDAFLKRCDSFLILCFFWLSQFRVYIGECYVMLKQFNVSQPRRERLVDRDYL